MEDRERPQDLAGGHPANRDLFFLNAFNQFPIPRNHGISTQPELAHLEILDNIEQSINMVVMRVREDHGIEPSYTAREEVRRKNAFADRKCALVAQVEEPAGRHAAAVDQHSIAGGEFD